MAKWTTNLSSVFWLPLILLFSLALCTTSCTCGGSSDDPGNTDHQIGPDDDTHPDDDTWPDDDSSTTTTSPGTTSTTNVSTTTTVPTTSTSTTTTTLNPGTACNPYRFAAEHGPAVPDFGPWPEYSIGPITYRQYLAGNAGIGQNAVGLDAQGRAWVFGMVGRSFDAYIFNDDDSVERQIVDPTSGFDSVVSLDENGVFHVVYADSNLTEIRYATNASGHWERTVLLSIPEGGIVFGSVRTADGTIHVAYECLENDIRGLNYFEWSDGSIQMQEQILAPENDVLMWGVSLALDATGRPAVVHIVEDDVWFYQRSDSGWEGARIGAANGETEMVVDDNGAAHVVFGSWSAGLTYATNAGGAWNVSLLDGCNGGPVQFQLTRDAAGALHLVYASANYGSIRHATNASGHWVFEQLVGTAGYYLGSAIAPDGSLHTASCDIPANMKFYYATNASGSWRRRLIAGGHDYGFSNFTLDQDDYVGFVVAELLDPSPGYMYYAADSAQGWIFELIESGPADAFADIATDRNGDVSVAYFDQYTGDYSQKYAHRIEPGSWSVETVIEGDNIFDVSRLVFDTNNNPHIGFQHRPYPGYAVKSGSAWETEGLPEFAFGDMALDPSDRPHMVVVSFNPGPWDFKHLWRDDQGNWFSEQILQTTDTGYAGISATVDRDGFVHTLVCCDYGYVDYATNRTGVWTKTSLGEWIHSGQRNFTVIADEFGNAYAALIHSFSRLGLSDGHALYYTTNTSGDFQFFKLDDRWDIGSMPTMRWASDGDIYIAYEAHGALTTAKFSPSLE